MYDVNNIFIIDDGDVLSEVEEILAEFAEPFLDFLQLGVFLGVDQLKQMLLLHHQDYIIKANSTIILEQSYLCFRDVHKPVWPAKGRNHQA